MTDREVQAENVDGLDAAWDDFILGRSSRTHSEYPADAATIAALSALADVPPADHRRIWSNALVQATEPPRQPRVRSATPTGRYMQVVAPSTLGRGWLPAGLIAAIASLAIIGGIMIGQNDGDDGTQALPSDASSIVATLPSSAPAWATPSGETTN